MTVKTTSVLLIEDDESHIDLILGAFKAHGFKSDLMVARDLGEARKILAERKPDLVITDLRLPDGIGTELLPGSIEDAAYPIIVMTCYGDEQAAVEAMKRGAIDYVTKSGTTLVNMPRTAERALREWDHIVERKRAHESIEHLNHLLRTITRVNQIIAKETDLQSLLTCATKTLVELQRYQGVWIAIMDDLDNLLPMAEAGFGENFACLGKQMIEGKKPACAKMALDRSGVVLIEDKQSTCEDCPLAGIHDGGKALAVQLRHNDRAVGLMVVSITEAMGSDPDEQGLFAMLGDDLAYAITTIKKDNLRMKAEQEHGRLAAIVKQAGEIIITADLEGGIEYVNPAFERITGYAPGEVKGLKWSGFIVSEHSDNLIKNIREAFLNKGGWSGRLQKRRKDGTIYHEETRIWPVRDSSGTIISLVMIGTDITEQQAMERQLLQAQKLESIGQLAAGIAHEINTPMQYVGDNTLFLKDSFEELARLIGKEGELLRACKEGKSTDELVSDVEAAIEAADVEYLSEEIPKAIDQSLDGIARVTEIVRAMKEFSHPDVDGKVATDINKAIQNTITVARNEYKYVAELVTDFDPSSPVVPCFPGEFNQVILNLITNAAHAIGKALGDNPSEKGLISISTRQNGEWLETRITDTGTGIPEEIRGRIFDPFFTTKEVGKGTGQGLSIAHAVITEKHKGTITFETENGKGTTFIIRIPISCEDLPKEGEQKEALVLDAGVK